MSNLVQYYVMKRPKHNVTGEIIRGKIAGAVRNDDMTIKIAGPTLWYPKQEDLLQANNTHMSNTAPNTDPQSGQIDGEPWLLHSVHFSLDEAVKAAKPVVSQVGSENTKILKSVAHEMSVKLV